MPVRMVIGLTVSWWAILGGMAFSQKMLMYTASRWSLWSVIWMLMSWVSLCWVHLLLWYNFKFQVHVHLLEVLLRDMPMLDMIARHSNCQSPGMVWTVNPLTLYLLMVFTRAFMIDLLDWFWRAMAISKWMSLDIVTKNGIPDTKMMSMASILFQMSKGWLGSLALQGFKISSKFIVRIFNIPLVIGQYISTLFSTKFVKSGMLGQPIVRYSCLTYSAVLYSLTEYSVLLSLTLFPKLLSAVFL